MALSQYKAVPVNSWWYWVWYGLYAFIYWKKWIFGRADMKFVISFTWPDFRAKNFTYQHWVTRPKNFIETDTETFFQDQNFWDRYRDFFSTPNIFETDTETCSRPNVFETDTETFSRDKMFPRLRPNYFETDTKTFFETKFFETDTESFNICAKNESVRAWWKKFDPTLPILSGFARSVLAIPASSAKSERAFSKGGNIVTR